MDHILRLLLFYCLVQLTEVEAEVILRTKGKKSVDENTMKKLITSIAITSVTRTTEITKQLTNFLLLRDSSNLWHEPQNWTT